MEHNQTKLPFLERPAGKWLVFGLAFFVAFIALHLILPMDSDVNFGPIQRDYFFVGLGAAALAGLLAFKPHWLRKMVMVISILGIAFVTLSFLLPGIDLDFLERFPEMVYILGQPVRSNHFFALVLGVILAGIIVFKPHLILKLFKFILSFWGFKMALSIVDVLIFRNLLRASNADNFTMWTVPLLFAFLTNFLPFFFAVAFKTHQEGFEDKYRSEASWVKRKLTKNPISENNRMKSASLTFLWVVSILLLATGFLISNQRWIQMTQSHNQSLAQFEDFGPHHIRLHGVDEFGENVYWYAPIYNPPLDELPNGAFLQNHWHLDESFQPVHGRYPGFLIDFTLLLLPLLLMVVTILASYFNASEKVINRWYQLLEDLTDRKKKKMRVALREYEEAKALFEERDLSYEQLVQSKQSEIQKLQVTLDMTEIEVSENGEDFVALARQKIRENALRTIESSYDTHINNLHGWVLSDLEVFKTKMAAHHEEVAVQHTLMSIDLQEIINDYNEKVEPIKQFDTAKKTEALMLRLNLMNERESHVKNSDIPNGAVPSGLRATDQRLHKPTASAT